jgi:predicted ThiF/HesA family dinucleotide-utilizing enzyme
MTTSGTKLAASAVARENSSSQPQIYGNGEELVHLIDLRGAMGECLALDSDKQGVVDAVLVSLETALRSFDLL